MTMKYLLYISLILFTGCGGPLFGLTGTDETQKPLDPEQPSTPTTNENISNPNLHSRKGMKVLFQNFFGTVDTTRTVANPDLINGVSGNLYTILDRADVFSGPCDQFSEPGVRDCVRYTRNPSLNETNNILRGSLADTALPLSPQSSALRMGWLIQLCHLITHESGGIDKTRLQTLLNTTSLTYLPSRANLEHMWSLFYPALDPKDEVMNHLTELASTAATDTSCSSTSEPCLESYRWPYFALCSSGFWQMK